MGAQQSLASELGGDLAGVGGEGGATGGTMGTSAAAAAAAGPLPPPPAASGEAGTGFSSSMPPPPPRCTLMKLSPNLSEVFYFNLIVTEEEKKQCIALRKVAWPPFLAPHRCHTSFALLSSSPPSPHTHPAPPPNALPSCIQSHR